MFRFFFAVFDRCCNSSDCMFVRVFFFKQKTAYEMRISDWSSDVCSSDLIARKDVRVGDTVIVQRAGDVIPQVVSVVVERRPKDAVPFVFPTKCPVCGQPAVREADASGAEDVRRRCSGGVRSEEHTSELQSLLRISYAVFCLKKKKT